MMGERPIRIQRKRTRGWRMPENTVCVDRSTGFGNPFPVVRAASTYMGQTKSVWVIGTWAGPAMWFRDTKPEAIELSVQAYRAWLNTPPQNAIRDKARVALRGKNLACWCPLTFPDGSRCPCHADVLLELANA